MIDVSKLNLSDTDIAIVGMAGRFPDAKNVTEFWQNLKNGVESVSYFSDRELKNAGVVPELFKDPDYIKAGVVFDELEMFDADFFGFSPKEAQIMDPQHRHFLECAWEVLESAGHMPDDFKGSIGVFAGCGMNSYMIFNLLTNPSLLKNTGLFLLRHTGNDKDFLTTRVSYDLNLKGPSINIQTACSTSLVASHIACQSLLNGECDLALAGGVTIELPHGQGYLFKEGEILSPDGHCRAFDEKAQGTIVGSGVGIIALRRASDAVRDGDYIHAIIKASAINNDGSTKVGYLAPSVDGQAEAVSIALAISNIDPETISYIETHGTGTAIGDPIEIAALNQAFKNYTDKKGFCRIGSLKTNIGHLDTAAGVAGLIKTVLSMENKQIPPSLNFEKPSPQIDFDNSPFVVNDKLTKWESNGNPRRAGISSLGVGGTNAHIIVEEAPLLPKTDEAKEWQLFNWSARSSESAERWKDNFYNYLNENPTQNLADISYTLQTGRKSFSNRNFIVGKNYEDTLIGLKDPKRIFSKKNEDENASVVFMFPGGGAQYPNMGLEIYQREEVYRKSIDECLNILNKKYELNLRDLIFPAEDKKEYASEQLQDPLNSILSIFITEYSLAKLWISWGVEPSAMTGHSLGEYAAACIAGVMTLEEALFMVVLRGQIFHKMPVGGMISLQLSEDEVRTLLINGVSIAAVNAPSLSVVSGTVEDLAKFENILQSKEIEFNRLKISVAAHSAMLEPFLDEFKSGLKTISLQKPSIPFISNLSGTFIAEKEATSTDYWVRQLRNTVRFSDGMTELFKEEDRVFLEVGPGVTLSSLSKAHTSKKDSHDVISSIRHPQENISDIRFILESLGKLWQNGFVLDWKKIRGNEVRGKVPLPTYSFDHKPYWISPGRSLFTDIIETQKGNPLEKLQNINDWFYKPYWKNKVLRKSGSDKLKNFNEYWLIFSENNSASNLFLDYLKIHDQKIIEVRAGEEFKRNNSNYELNTGDYDEYRLLLRSLSEEGKFPAKILYFPGKPLETNKKSIENIDKEFEKYFFNLFRIAKAYGEEGIEKPTELFVISNNVIKINNEKIDPIRSLLSGPVKVIPNEFPIKSKLIDVEAVNDNLPTIFDEFFATGTDSIVAIRNNERFIEDFNAAESGANHTNKLKEKGVYLLTGGFGGIGFTLAKYLAKEYKAKLALVNRHAIPSKSSWDNISLHTNGNEKTLKTIDKVKELESLGAEVMAIGADVNDFDRMKEVIWEIDRHFGKIDGVINAAGTIDDALIQMKTEESVRKVLLPKVKGTLILSELFKDKPLDFLLNFSSTSSIIGSTGQIDYTSANAFLDAFAVSDASKNYTTTINWGQWREVGMAARLAQQNSIENEIEVMPGLKTNHPLLDKRVSNSESESEFITVLDVRKLWILNEHKLKAGNYLIPGTAYLEFARAAFEYQTGNIKAEMNNVYFMSPIMLAEDEQKLLSVKFKKENNGFEFIISVKNEDNNWDENVRGIIKNYEADSLPKINYKEIIDRCKAKIEEHNGIAKHDYMQFGYRWGGLKKLRYGLNEAVAEIQLDDNYIQDLTHYKLHPAMMDIATGSAQSLAGYDIHSEFFVPVSYNVIKIYRPFSPKIFSHIYLMSKPDDHKDTASFNVRIFDEEGEIIADVKDFMMKKVKNNSVNLTKEDSHKRKSGLLEIGQRAAITPEEGIEVFKRILSSEYTPRIITVSQDLHNLIDSVNALSSESGKAKKNEARNNISSVFKAPESEIEKEIASIWEEVLGVNNIGIKDDFFELGGHSLLLTRIVLKTKKKFNVELSLGDLFENPTIEKFVNEVLKAKEENRTVTQSAIKAVSRDGYRIKKSGN